jgi:hypothetical protein
VARGRAAETRTPRRGYGETVRMVSLEHLGAWLLKCNGNTSGIRETAAQHTPIRQWCVQASYRTELMAATQPVLFWVSGNPRRLTPGVWATGELTGPPVLDSDGDHPKLRVPLDLRWLDEPGRVARAALQADERLAAMEVLRQPQAANPSFVTKAQFAAIRDHIAAASTPAAGAIPLRPHWDSHPRSTTST